MMKVVSLFSGCGGLDLGFERAGFNVIWANEFDKSIHETYRLNHPNTTLNTSDIRTLSGNDIPDCDGIIGGPPCQAWSEGGKGLGIEDPRGQLFWDYIRIVKEKKPKFFLIENVQGILEEKHKESLDGFLTVLRDAGYNITYELLNAADYRIPQDRFRVFFIGIRNDLLNKYTFPDAESSVHVTLRQAIGDIVEIPRYYSDNKVVEGNHPARMNHDVYTGAYDAKYMSRNRVRGWDETSFTMQAQARNAPQHPQSPKMTYISPSQRAFVKGYEHLYRRLSVRECARIQTFPDSFKFIYSDIKDGYKMVGNAVPPRLAWYLAMQMKKAFSDLMTLSDNEKKIYERKIIRVPISEMSEKLSKILINGTKVNNNNDVDKRVLISLVKNDNAEDFINKSAKIYYTGKFFPSSVDIEQLHYFMPYIKGKGIRDLYIIKSLRVGSKAEVHPKCDKNDLRLLFEIEYVRQLFDVYQPIHLNIWQTFTDTSIDALQKMNDQ